MSEADHPQADERLSAYLDDELSAEERAEFEALLATRSDYQEALAQWQRMRDGLRQLPSQQLDPSAQQEIMQRIRQTDPAGSRSAGEAKSAAVPASSGNRAWRTRGLAIVATLAAGLLVAVGLMPRPAPRELVQHDKPSGGGEVAPPAATPQEQTEEEGSPVDGRLQVAPQTTMAEAAPASEPSAIRDEMRMMESVADDEALRGDEEMEAGRLMMADSDSHAATGPASHPARESSGNPWGAGKEGRRGRSRSAPSRGTPDPIPEIVIQANNRRVYDELLAALANADAEDPSDDEQLLGYHQARRQQGLPLEANPAVVQVVEVTGTAAQVAELIESAQTQGAVLLNAAVVEAQLPGVQQNQIMQRITKMGRKRDEDAFGDAAVEPSDQPESGFIEEDDTALRQQAPLQGLVVNSWLPADASEGFANEATPPARDNQVPVPKSPAPAEEAVRWRIRIVPTDAANSPG